MADIVIFDPLSPGMVCAAVHDPVTAIVLHSSVRDVDTVIVDGIVRKESGKLCAVDVDKEMGVGNVLEWKDVAAELVKSRQSIQEKVERIDYEKALKSIIKTFSARGGYDIRLTKIDQRLIHISLESHQYCIWVLINHDMSEIMV